MRTIVNELAPCKLVWIRSNARIEGHSPAFKLADYLSRRFDLSTEVWKNRDSQFFDFLAEYQTDSENAVCSNKTVNAVFSALESDSKKEKNSCYEEVEQLE